MSNKTLPRENEFLFGKVIFDFDVGRFSCFSFTAVVQLTYLHIWYLVLNDYRYSVAFQFFPQSGLGYKLDAKTSSGIQSLIENNILWNQRHVQQLPCKSMSISVAPHSTQLI